MAQEHSWDESHLLGSGGRLEEVPNGMHKDRSRTDTCPEFLLYYYNAAEIVTIAKLAAPSNICVRYGMEILFEHPAEPVHWYNIRCTRGQILVRTLAHTDI